VESVRTRPGKDKDTEFWHEKMRFSQASQSLFDASVKGDTGLANQAVRGLGDPNCCSRRGYRPLQVAISCGNTELIGLLCKAGADVNSHAKGTPPPLVLAAGNLEDKRGEVFQALLDQGADLNGSEELVGETALTRAADRGQGAVVQLILRHGTSGYQKLLAQRPRSGPEGDGKTALHLAAGHGFTQIVDRLLGVGADPSAMDRQGRQPLHWAAEGNHVEAVSILLNFGGPSSGQDKTGAAPMHLAAAGGFLHVADLLVRFGADVNSRRADGQVPLHLAAERGHDTLCQLLLAHGAEPNVVDAACETPCSRAMAEAHVRCCKVLLASGAQVRPVDSQRWVPPYTEMDHELQQQHRRKGGEPAQDDSVRELIGC